MAVKEGDGEFGIQGPSSCQEPILNGFPDKIWKIPINPIYIYIYILLEVRIFESEQHQTTAWLRQELALSLAVRLGLDGVTTLSPETSGGAGGVRPGGVRGGGGGGLTKIHMKIERPKVEAPGVFLGCHM